MSVALAVNQQRWSKGAPCMPTVVESSSVETRAAQRDEDLGASQRNSDGWEEDRALVAAILGGSEAHFVQLYEAYAPRLLAFATSRLHDAAEAEDVVQEVFAAASRSLPSFAGESSLLSWLFGITRHKLHRRFRKPRPFLEALDGELGSRVEAFGPSVDREVEARRVLSQCSHLLETELTPLQRRIFHLKHFRRQSIHSIAIVLGKSEDAIKANLYRIRRSILQVAPDLEALLEA